MDATPFAIATRLLLIGVVAVCVITLLWASFDRRRPLRARVPIVALAFLVAFSVLPTFWIDVPLVMALAQASFLIFTVLFATYPDGRFVPRWTIALIVLWIPLTAWIVASGGTLTSEAWWWTVPTVTGLALIGAQLYRYLRRSTQAEREATRWAILGLGSSMLLFLVLGLIGEIGTLGTDAEAWANLAGIPFLVGPTIGLVRPRLWNVDAAFRAVLTIAGAALPLAVVYAGRLARRFLARGVGVRRGVVGSGRGRGIRVSRCPAVVAARDAHRLPRPRRCGLRGGAPRREARRSARSASRL